MNNYYVYAHYDEDGCFYYGIGKGKRCYSTASRNEDWWRHALIDNVVKFEVEILNDNLTKEKAEKFEREFIDNYGLENLSNKQRGNRDKSLDEFINYGKFKS